MGNAFGKKEHVCVICTSEDCGKNKNVCDQCEFIHKFIINYGRHTLHDITINHDRSKRPRVVNLLPSPPSQRGNWSSNAPSAPVAMPPPGYNYDRDPIGARYPKNY